MKTTVKRFFCMVTAFALLSTGAAAAEVSDFYSGDLVPVEGSVAVSPEKNLFSVDGSDDKWILLDASEDGVFVLKDAGCGTMSFDTYSKVWTKFDPQRSTNIAAAINKNEFVSEYIPEAIAGKMKENTWTVAAGKNAEEYVVNSQVVLLSAEEYAKYYEKIGYQCGDGWFLRDPHPTNATAVVEVAVKDTSSKAAGKLYNVSAYSFNKREIRPACMLENDFFLSVKLNLGTTGESVFEYIKNTYDREQLSHLYDETEIKMIFEGLKSPSVKNVRLIGENKTGSPITFDYDFVPADEVQEKDSIVKWYISNTSSAGYTEIDVEDEYYILPSHGGKYLTVEVTPKDENGIFGKPVKSTAMGPLAKSAGPLANQTSLFPNQEAPAAEENLFKVNGWENRFILLDEKDGKYFIGTADDYGIMPYDSNGNVKFNPADPANIGYYLNNDILKGTRIPAPVLENIVRDTVWFTEAGNELSNSPHDYYTTAAIALMSFEEWKTYYDKFGFDNGYTSIGWWLRTPMGQGDVSKDMLAVRTNASSDFQGRAFQYGGTVGLMVRPVFWVENDFFKDVKLDTDTMGSAVKKMILSKYSMNDLSKGNAGYSKEELAAIGFDGAPIVSDLHISGISAVGNELEAAYKFSCKTPEGKSKYQWFISDSSNGAYLPLEGQNERQLKVTEEMEGKYVKFSVIPESSDGIGGLETDLTESVKIFERQPFNIAENRVSGTDGEYPDLDDNVILWNISLTGDAAELVLITAVYGENNSLISVTNTDYSFGGDEQTFSKTITRDGSDNARMIKMILLDKNGNRPLVLKEIQ